MFGAWREEMKALRDVQKNFAEDLKVMRQEIETGEIERKRRKGRKNEGVRESG